MEISETTIIAACKRGEMEQFVYLYDQYVEKIYKFLYFRTFDQALSEDLTSQVFLKAMEKISTVDESKGTFQAWLYRIARNLLIDEYRRSKPTEGIESHYDLASDVNIESETGQTLTNEKLRKLLLTLPKESQELVSMRLWDELPYAEIAAITGKSEGSLKMQFSRIIDQLQKHAHLLALTLFLTRI
jgi:RNA polymerase sigma-70 factor, ECF subfamily